MATMTPQEVTRRLTLIAEERGVSGLAAKFQSLEKVMSQTGASIKTVEKQFASQEQRLSAVAKATADLERTATVAFKALAAGAVDAARAENLVTIALEKHNAELLKSKSAADLQTEAINKQKRAYEEEGAALRKAAQAQEFYNRTLGVSSGGSINSQALAAQMRARVLETEAEIARRQAQAEASARAAAAGQARWNDPFRSGLSGKSAAMSADAFGPMFAAEQKAELVRRQAQAEALARSSAEAQARIADPFRSGLSGKSASDSASVFAESFKASEQRTRALVEEGRAVRTAAEAQEYYNRILGVGARNTNGAAIAAQMEARYADVEAEIARRNAAGGNRMAAQSAFARQFSQGLSGKSAADSASVFEAGFAAQAKRLEEIRSRYDQAYKAGRDYAKAVAEINDLHKAGSVTDQQRMAMLQERRAEYRRVMEEEVNGGRLGRLGESPLNRLSLHQARNLGFQINDVITGVMSGQSLPMIAAQQGGQIFQILQDGPGGLGGSIERLGGYLAGLMTPIRLVIGGFTAIAGVVALAFDSAVNRSIAVTQSLNGLGAASGATSSQLMAIARQAASAGGISNISGIQYASQFAGAGIRADLAGRLTGGVRRFSQAFGGDEADNAKMLASAFADPARGAEELNKRLGFLSVALDDEIKKKQALGDLDGARESLFKAYNAALQNAAVQTNGLSEAFHAVKTAASNLWEGLGRLVTPSNLQERLDAAAKIKTPEWNPYTGNAFGNEGESFGDLFRQAMVEAGKRLKAEVEIEANRQSFIDRTRTRLIEDSSLNVGGILARTSSEKALIESQRAYIQVMRETKDAVLANIAAENARNQAMAEAERVLRDYKRAAADEAFLGGARNERERYMRQLQIEQRDLREKTDILRPQASIPDDQYYARVTMRSGTGWFPSPDTQNAFLRNISPLKNFLPPQVDNYTLGPLSKMMSQFGLFSTPEGTVGGWNRGVGSGGGSPRQLTLNRGGFGNASNAPGPVDQNRLANWDANKFGQMMHDAEVAIQAQNRALETQRANFGKSVEEVARFNEQTRMENELARTGIPLTDERAQKIAEVATKYGEATAAQERFKETLATLNDMRSGFMDFGNSMASAFIRGERGAKLLQAGVNSLTNSLQRMAMRMLDKAIFGDQNMSGGLLGSLFSSFMGGGGGVSPLPAGMGSGTGGIYALGGAFSGGNVIPFARGGVVSRPTLFPMANGAGLMGEAGPEAIMPLRRGPDGRLGVSGAGGGGGGVVIINENHTRTASMETKQEKGPDGRTIIRQIIREEVSGMIASGDTDSANRARYGIQARKVMRG